jgi:hypothetical protein
MTRWPTMSRDSDQAQAGLFLLRSSSPDRATDARDHRLRGRPNSRRDAHDGQGPATAGKSRRWPRPMAWPTWSVWQRTTATRSASVLSYEETSGSCRQPDDQARSAKPR